MALLTSPRSTSSSFSLSSLFLHAIVLYSTNLANGLANNETDRFALLKFKASISADPNRALSSWNDSAHFCGWPGISCGRRHRTRATALDLGSLGLQGTISPFIGNLSFLRLINLKNNAFSGEIPRQVGRLYRLRHLNLGANALEGKIPINLTYCSQLTELRLDRNNLAGPVPPEIGSLPKLVKINLDRNGLTGTLPPSLGNISSLATLSVHYNSLGGIVPNELGNLKNLTYFGVGANDFSGTVPPSLYNISSLKSFVATSNRLRGTLPPKIGLTLPNLQDFLIANNTFSGTLPESFSNASQLTQLEISTNYFSGQLRVDFRNLQDLWYLNLGFNNLGNYSDDSLGFFPSLTNCSALEILNLAQNNFQGVFPASAANLSASLIRLYLGENKISGKIPAGLENLDNLIILSLDTNLLTGEIPTSLGKLRNLQSFQLQGNMLSGEIPTTLSNLTKLSELYLSDNKLEGTIPPVIGKYCQSLQLLAMSNNRLRGTIPREIFGISSLLFLNLSGNALRGGLPAELGKLNNIAVLDVSENSLTSEIPESIGDCQNLQVVFLEGNSIQGKIPSALASLKGLEWLDLSRNNLSGKIPDALGNLRFLSYLNLSFNYLEGKVPEKGVFRNASAISVVPGNAKLCGGVPELNLPRCPNEDAERRRRRTTLGRKVKIIMAFLLSLFLVLLGLGFLYWKRKTRRVKSDELPKIGFLSKVSYKRLHEATGGFSAETLIGIGSFGSVYKGILEQGENPVAIKVIDLRKKGAEKSFVAECNALKSIRHRNLVRVLTCCSSVDYKGDDFKALVFEYMSHGSLEKWIRVGADQCGLLSLVQRLNIAIDVASAMCYLHNDCHGSIIHRDLKPSNILLDDEMIARVSDFGLARLVLSDGQADGQTNTTGINGTVGYVPPEYATGSEPSKQGDTFSYGIVVLEMFSGRRPTDEMFVDDFNLHNFVKTSLPERLERIVVDPALLSEPRRREVTENDNDSDENGDITSHGISAHLQRCLVSVLEIGLACSQESPDQRMSISDVIKEIKRVRNAFLTI